jgi:cell division protein FtsI (penicillin-binding protein 3)
MLVSRVTDATGALTQDNAPDPGRPAMRPEVARLVSEFLTAVTEEQGTGTEAAIPGVRVAGKTGTAQKAREHAHGYDDQRWVSSFIGFAPADRARLVVTVVIDEPQITHAGGTVAAPVFRRVMEQSLRYLGALPTAQRAIDFPRAAPTPAAPRRTARERAEARNAPCVVPDLTRRSMREALRTLHELGLEGDLSGSGIVVRQDPPAGTACAGVRVTRAWLEPGGGYVPVATQAPAATEVQP